jgi:hypothetical protein
MYTFQQRSRAAPAAAADLLRRTRSASTRAPPEPSRQGLPQRFAARDSFIAAPESAIQRKASVSAPDDPLEHEADAVADRVMRMAEPAPIGTAAPSIQRKCAACEEDDKQQIQTKRTTSASGAATFDVGSAAQAAARAGIPLPGEVRSYFEPRFGHDFSGVRVHTDGAAAAAAQGVQARAYTLGRDIVFAGGEYSPHTMQGRKLLAHELVHVVQQDRAGTMPERGAVVAPEHSAEREADSAADAVIAGKAVAPSAAPASGLHRKMHNKVLLEPTRTDAKACLVHLHGEEHTAAAVAKELYGRRCVNYVHLDTDQGPLSGSEQRLVRFDVDVNSVNYTCKADPNRVFSDKGRRDDAIHKWVEKTEMVKDSATGPAKPKKVSKKVVNCEPASAAAKTAGISEADIVKAAAAELKTFVDGDWAANISKCRGGAGTPDLAGPLAVLALHNNEGGNKPADAILGKYQGQLDTRDTRVAPDANPNYSAEKASPSDVFLVTKSADYTAIKDTYNVGIQASPVPAAGEDGSLSVALQTQRFINVEKKGRDHAALINVGSGFQGHDSVYVKNYAMAVKALDVLGVPEGQCPAAVPAVAPPVPAAPAPMPTLNPPASAAPQPAADTKTSADPAKQQAEAEAKKKTEPYPPEQVTDKDVPVKGCLHFDAASIGTRKGHWAARIATLPVLDVVNWIVGAWDLEKALPATMPNVVQDGVREAFAQRGCLLTAMDTGVKAQGGKMPAGDLKASGARSFQKQKIIWDNKWKFVPGLEFDRISAHAAAKSGGLLKADAKWKTSEPLHRLMWGVVPATDTKDKDVKTFIAAKASVLTTQEREQEILMASSAPGVSRHHAGTDFDIGQGGENELEPELWAPGEKYFDLGRWLFHNAATWGFMRPFESKGGYGKGYMAEPWHWSYWPIAQALLEFARKNQQDVEAMLHAHWQKTGAGSGAQPQFDFIWGAWKNFLNNVDETPRF